jgi:S1-C subfamily serine protease
VSRDRAAAEEMVRRTGQMGVPVTAIGNEMVVGFNRPKLQQIITRLRTAQPPPTLGAAVKDAPGGGALVGTVRPGTPAERGGLKPGDLIIAVDGTAVAGVDSLAQLIQGARGKGSATLAVERAGNRIALRIPFVTG